MRIYAACLASYNSGILHGKWIDVAGEWVDEIRDQISAMLEKSPAPGAEEYAIHDYDDLPNFGEHPDLQAIADYSRLVESAAESGYNQDEVRAIVDNYNGNIEDAEKALENTHGVWDSWRDYADEHADELLACESLESFASRYFDYEAYARDLAHDYTALDVQRGVLVIANF